ncbi:small nuclear RNA activating complex, polypeptide 3 [Mortierella antarctica]|nr:small nuclear RNA activating complex, polypeptide 3 [Mortierella antarctica]
MFLPSPNANTFTMSHAASGSSSCPQAQGLRQTGTSEQLSDETVTSIINVAPQGALFPVLPFGVSFTRLIDEQREHDAYHEYFDDCEQEQEVAERCDVWDDLQDANKFFDDPTLRGLLQEWYEGRLEECKDPIDKALRPTWSSIYGQVDEVTEYGDRSNLHLKEHPRPPGLGDENVQRLLGASVRGRRRVLSNSDRFAVRIGAEKRRRLFLEEPKRRQMRAKWGRPWDVVAPAAEKRDEQHESSTPVGEGTSEPSSVTASASGLVPISTTATATASTPAPAAASAPTTTLVSTAESTVASTASSAAASTAAQASATTSAANPAHLPASESEANNSLPTTDESTATKSTAQPQPRTDKTGPPERTDQDDLDLVLEVSEKRAEEDGRVGTTPLEDRFHTQSMAVEDSSLQSLAERNRFEVPVELRPPMNYIGPGTPRFSVPYVPILGPEIIVSVALYSSLNPTKRTQEFLFLGSQPLTALRDAFHCISDFVNQGAEEQQDSPIKNKSDKKISNSFIFIEGVFYTDTPLSRAKIDKRNELWDKERKQLQQHELGSSKERSKGKGVARRAEAAEELDDADFREQRNQTGYQDVPLEQIKLKDEHLYAAASQDYGQVIIDWVASNPQRQLDPDFANLRKKHMHDTLIQDLSIRINHPYLLVHQGNCEHLLMFRDLRLFSHRYDDQNLLSYPKAIFKSKQTRHRCRMCNTNPAFYITIDDRLAGETPSYFCEECYDVFHYDEDGNILYDDFKVFLYAHDEAK